MVSLKNKQHLFFDLDDTLWDFQRNSAIVLEQLFAEYSLQDKLKVSFDDFLQTYKQVNYEFWSLYYKKRIDKHYLRNNRFNETFNRFGYDNYNENLEITEEYLGRAPKGNFLKEGCLEVLDYLKQKYRLHIITNGFREVQFIKLNGSGLNGYFENIIISEEHQLVKPDVEIFRLAEKMAGAGSGQCVMIGDSFESDIEGALNAGWDAIYFAENNTHDFKGPQIRQLEDLKDLF